MKNINKEIDWLEVLGNLYLRFFSIVGVIITLSVWAVILWCVFCVSVIAIQAIKSGALI